MSIRVAIVEDQAAFRQTLELVLANTPGFEAAGSFGSVEALERVLADPVGRARAWNVVVMDLDLPGKSGIEGIRAVKSRAPGVAVLVCTVFEEPATLVEAIGAGADGYVVKGAPLDVLLDQLRVVAGGGGILSATVARTLLDVVRANAPGGGPGPARLDLTEREREVLRCLVDGKSYKQAADDLGVSTNTVRTHIKALYKKLQVQNVAEAVSRAVRQRLV